MTRAETLKQRHAYQALTKRYNTLKKQCKGIESRGSLIEAKGHLDNLNAIQLNHCYSEEAAILEIERVVALVSQGPAVLRS